MATESRVVTFTNTEVIEALLEFCAQSNRPAPEGGVRQITFSNDRQVKLMLEPEKGDAPLSFYEHEVAAALILFCRKTGIPIPRRAAKSLQVAPDSVALHLTIRS